MVKLRCQDCGRIVEGEESDIDEEKTCKECEGYFAVLGTEDDVYEEPSKIETEIEYPKKIIEKPIKVYVDKDGVPLDSSFNPLDKSKFD